MLAQRREAYLLDDKGNKEALPKQIKFDPVTQSFEVFTTVNRHAKTYKVLYRVLYLDYPNKYRDCTSELIIEKSKTPYIPVFV